MDCFVRKYLVQLKIMNVIAGNIRVLDTVELYVIGVVWRLQGKKSGAIELGILPWRYRLSIFGI